MWNKEWKKGIDYPAWGDTDVYKKTIAGGYLFYLIKLNNSLI